jgi:hypothetical protein
MLQSVLKRKRFLFLPVVQIYDKYQFTTARTAIEWDQKCNRLGVFIEFIILN